MAGASEMGLFRVDIRTGVGALVECNPVPRPASGRPVQGEVAVLALGLERRRRGTLTLLAQAPGETDWKFVRKISC